MHNVEILVYLSSATGFLMVSHIDIKQNAKPKAYLKSGLVDENPEKADYY